ncbi:SpoIID/LytB domain-containing protein [Melioribacter sp. OK-6-Me]|uniref:SpoIID/LytB domain-containing protein n=1 Tax=unclassified Melioribacter TaxID=2627329 RepID=UPI003ED95298
MTEPEINIGILTAKEIRFDLYGEFKSNFDTRKCSGDYRALIEGEKIVVYKGNNKVGQSREIIFTPNDIDIESFVLYDVVIGKNFHWQKKEKQRFRGTLRLFIEDGSITAVNIIPLEEYLTSVIASEMNANSSPELLKAHAVISRSWILFQLEKKKDTTHHVNELISDEEIIRWYDSTNHNNYDFCSDDHCQRYQGITRIINENVYSAVESTRGIVLMYDDKVCDTRYSKCCGGITESFENVWEPIRVRYLVSVTDYKFEIDGIEYDLTKEQNAEKWINISPHAFCNTTDPKILQQILNDYDRKTDFFRWRVEYSQDKLSSIIKEKSGIDFGHIIDLEPVKRGYSGRIIKLKIRGTKKTLTVGKELEIRKWLSPTHLYSSAFSVYKENIKDNIPDKFILKGAGWGHGVGLCQIGAASMSNIGYQFDEILLHYFKGAKIKKIY